MYNNIIIIIIVYTSVQGHTLARIKGKSDEEEKPKMKLSETQESQVCFVYI